MRYKGRYELRPYMHSVVGAQFIAPKDVSLSIPGLLQFVLKRLNVR